MPQSKAELQEELNEVRERYLHSIAVLAKRERQVVVAKAVRTELEQLVNLCESELSRLRLEEMANKAAKLSESLKF